MPTRNLPAEKNAISVFQRQRGALPSNSNDWAAVHRIAYPTANDLPDEFKATEAASYYDAGVSQPPAPQAGGIPNVSSSGDPAYIQSLTDQTNQAKTQSDQAFQAYDDMPSGNEALRVLQEAIKAKSNPKDFSQAPIGESEIFKQAGVGGYGALASSLSARGKEFDANRADFANTISQMADVYKTQATATQRRYEKSVDDYQFLSQQLNRTLDQMRQDEQQIRIINLQNDLQKELKEMDYGHDMQMEGLRAPTVRTSAEGTDTQWDPTSKTWIPVTDVNSGIVSGFNIGRYATDPNHERAVASIVQGIGKFENLSDVQDYISKKYPNSPITTRMISNTSQKFGVPWEMLVAMMEQDSSLGTAGKGARTFNPGNVGNDDAGNIRNYGNWQAGVDAVGQWLSKNRAAAPTQTVDSKAKKTAMDIFSGTSNQKLTDVPTKDRPAVAAELTKLKEAAMSSGDVEGAIRASAGGTNPSDAFKQSFEKGINVVNQIGDLKKSITDQATGPVMGIIRSNNPYDTKAQKIKAQLTAIVPNLARGVYGEVGVLTDQDVELYAKTLPNLKSTEEVNKALLGIAVRSVQRSLETKIEVQAGSGTDVSGLLNVYQKVKKQADNILGPETKAGPSVTASGVDLSKFER